MFPWPYLDRPGFVLRTPMPASDVAIVASIAPGYIEARIRAAQSYIEARLRKRYARSIPFGGTAPALDASGTNPPGVLLKGTPQIGSIHLKLAISTAGTDGTAQFTWSLDDGETFVGALAGIALFNPGLGYGVAPTVTIDPPPRGGTQATATATIDDDTGAVTNIALTNAGAGYTAIPTVTLSPGPTPAQSAVAICAGVTPAPLAIPAYSESAPVLVPLLGTGLSALFLAGTYSADNLFCAPSPVPEIILGWITSIITPDVYRKRGVNPQDIPIEQLEADRVRVLGTDGKGGELREAADGESGLLDIPTDDALTSAVSNGPLGYSEASPYVAFDREEAVGRAEDYAAGFRWGGGFGD